MINIGRLQHSMDFLTQHPELHDQCRWGKQTPCGTTYCLAGHIVTTAGYELEWIDGEASYTTDGYWIPTLAQELTGLSDYEAFALFFTSKTLEHLWLRVEAYTDGAVSRRWTTNDARSDVDELAEFYRDDTTSELMPA